VDGELVSLDEEIKLDKRRNHTIDAVVDRLLIKPGINERLTESVRTALKLTNGAVVVSVVDGEEKLYSERMACVNCGINVPPLEPRSFSFNSAYGACKRCHGLGTVLQVDPAKLIPEAKEPAGKLVFLGTADKQGSAYLKSALAAVLAHYGVTADVPFSDLPRAVRDAFFHGVEGHSHSVRGVTATRASGRAPCAGSTNAWRNAPSEKVQLALEELVSPVTCPECKGRRLQPESLAVRVGGLGIADYTAMTIEESVRAFAGVTLSGREEQVAGLVLREIRNRLGFLERVGLGYITLDRASATLSGGEGSASASPRRSARSCAASSTSSTSRASASTRATTRAAGDALGRVRDLGNTVLVVEHDEETIRRADYVVDLGPRPARTAARSSPRHARRGRLQPEPPSPACTSGGRSPSRCRRERRPPGNGRRHRPRRAANNL
jgi:excinuclease ABC subunit A